MQLNREKGGGGGGGYVEQPRPRSQGCFVTKPKVFRSYARILDERMFLSLQVSFVVLEFSFSSFRLLSLKVLWGNDYSNNDWSS